MRPSGHQAASYAVRAVVQAGRDGYYVLAGLVIHSIAVVERRETVEILTPDSEQHP